LGGWPLPPLVKSSSFLSLSLGVTVDLDEAVAREGLGFNFGVLLAQSNALLTSAEPGVMEAKTKEETSSLARLFATHEAALREGLAHLRHSEESLNKQLHT